MRVQRWSEGKYELTRMKFRQGAPRYYRREHEGRQTIRMNIVFRGMTVLWFFQRNQPTSLKYVKVYQPHWR